MLTDYLVPRGVGGLAPFDVRRGMNRFFSELAPDLRGGWPFGAVGAVAPASNVWETQDAYFVEMAAPGLAQDDISLSMTGSELTIGLESPSVGQTEREGRYWRRERSQVASTFSMTFPTAVDSQDVTAELENGALLVKIPKTEKAQVKKICVNKAECGKTKIETNKSSDDKTCRDNAKNCHENA